MLEFYVIAKRYLFIDLQTHFLENVSYDLNMITLAAILFDYFEMKSNCLFFHMIMEVESNIIVHDMNPADGIQYRVWRKIKHPQKLYAAASNYMYH